MKKILSILMFCVYADHFGQTVVYEQNFDGLTVGTSLMNQITTGEWATWTNTIGGNNDPFISNEQSVSGNNSLKITPNDDVIYYFGNLNNGHYKVDFDVYIADNKSYYVNLQHEKAINWLNETKLINDTVHDFGWDNNLSQEILTPLGNYNSNTWNQMTYDFDFDNETLTYLVNSDTIYSISIYTTANNRPSINLDVINFFGINANSEYYIDNFKVSAWKEHGTVTLETPNPTDYENIASGELTLTNSAHGMVKYDAQVLFDHHSTFDQGPTIQKSFETS
ncbi:MAG: hypothetical protein ACPGSD_16405 [Flavobacteriales bacterium]